MIEMMGRTRLQGEVKVQGSKNASLPILAASILVSSKCKLINCPRITDVFAMFKLLEKLGSTVRREADGILIVPAKELAGRAVVPAAEEVCTMRSSLCLLGALLGKGCSVEMCMPGGCVIGSRPIDMHLDALSRLGARFELRENSLRATADKLHGADIALRKPSVGATENILLAAATAEGRTRLSGAAKEPEIVFLADFLNACGAKIEGAGTDCILVDGVGKLSGTEYVVPADRIVAGTYLLACTGIGGSIFLENAPCEQLTAVSELAAQMGSKLWQTGGGLFVDAPERCMAVPTIRTDVYPAFPTDLQSVALAVCAGAEGETRIEETVFENRFRIVDELRKMGACIEQTSESEAVIEGVERLRGTELRAAELRGGAALVTAGLMATGKSVLTGTCYINRGYENICRDFKELGARIVSG